MRFTHILPIFLIASWSVFALGELDHWVAESAANTKAAKARKYMDRVDTTLSSLKFEGEKRQALYTFNFESFDRETLEAVVLGISLGGLEDDLEDVAKLARHPNNRARALLGLAAVRKWQGDNYEAFKAYRETLDLYANIVPIGEIVSKEYNLATNGLMLGKREHLWLPFKGNLQAVEVYEHIVKVAPQHFLAPISLFRAGILMHWEEEYPESIRLLRKLIHSYPNDRSVAYAQVEIASVMLDAASEFDGDGSLTKEAKTYLDRFFALYPQYEKRELAEAAPDEQNPLKTLEERRDQAVELIARANELEAERYLYLAKFYQHKEHDSDEGTRRFLKRIVNDYAETEPAPEAQQMLAALPPPKPRPVTPEPEEVRTSPKGKPTASPANSSAQTTEEAAEPTRNKSEKWLLPIRDVDTDKPIEDAE